VQVKSIGQPNEKIQTTRRPRNAYNVGALCVVQILTRNPIIIQEISMNTTANAVLALAERRFSEFKIRNGQVVPEFCPFCNGGENGDRNTFAVGLYNGAYQCLRGGCGKKGSFRDLCEFFGEKSPEEVSFQAFTGNKRKEYERPNVEMGALTEEITTYFGKRRISQEVLDEWKIASDTNGNIVFPFYRDGELIYVKYRNPLRDKNDKKTAKEWGEKNTEPILFGMDMVSFNQPLVITEGEIDALSVYEAGYHNVVSVPCGCNNMEWITLCWDWLEKFSQIILFGDNDDPGIAMVNTLCKRLGEDRCMIPSQYPELIVDGKDYGRLCKDANEILYAYGEEFLLNMIKSCEPVPIKGVINLASVPFIDPSTVPRIFTKIPALDEAIAGFGEGQLLVFTGKRGEGKSTLNGTMLLNAIQQGYNVCAYSGELSAQNFLNWIFLQATEDKYIGISEDKRTGKKYPCVSLDIQKRIRDWIDNRFFLFDNAYVDEKNQETAILKMFDICARRYGCKLYLVD
jgi:twinkle protein